MAKTETPLLDQLEGGKWPSFVKDIKQAAEKNHMAEDLLRQLELSYKVKKCWLREGMDVRRPLQRGSVLDVKTGLRFWG